MSQQMFYVKEPTASSLRVCRGCLATDTRLYDMRQNRLMEAYIRLVQVTDDLPHYLCSYCATLLLKCDTFRIKCIDALLIFRNAQLDNVQLNMHHIKQIDRMSNKLTLPYKISAPEYLNIDDIALESNLFEQKQEPNFDVDLESLKGEIDVEENDIYDEITVDSDKVINKHDLLNNLVFYPTTAVNNYNIVLNDGNTDVIKKPMIDENEQSKSKMGYEKKINVDDAVKRDIKKTRIKQSKFKNKINVEDSVNSDTKEAVKEANDSEINTDMKRKRNRYDELDYEMISREYNMDIKVFNTKEEQIANYLELMENRKNNVNNCIKFKCKICFKGFVADRRYNKHMKLHKNRWTKYECDICNLRLVSKFSYVWHKARHTHSFSCRQCGFTTDLPGLATEHHKRHESKVVCKYCERTFNAQSSYYSHLKQAHPTSDKLIRCEMCGDSFCGSNGMKRHELFAHKEMRSPECYCSSCNTQFYCSDAFKAHQGADGLCITTHKYCVRCGMSFETEQLLNEHEIEQQKPRDEFECDVCGKKFSAYSYLITHRKIHQPNYAPPKRIPRPNDGSTVKRKKPNNPTVLSMCEVCGAIFQNRGLLQLHYRARHCTEKKFECTECPKKFLLPGILKSHMLVHSGERPYKCELCPKAFKSSSNRYKHTQIHTGERPFSCNVCLKSFQTKSNVAIHIKTVHMKVPMPPRIRNKKKTE